MGGHGATSVGAVRCGINRAWRHLTKLWFRVGPVVSWIIYVEWALWLGFMAVSQAPSQYADSTADWMAAAAAAEGVSPYQDLRALADRFGVEYASPVADEVVDEHWVHPRTPAALFLLQPALLATPRSLHAVLIWVSVAFLAVIAVTHWAQLAGVRRAHALLLAAVMLTSTTVLRSLQFGAWSVLLAGLLAVFWEAGRRGSDRLAGLSLGLLISVRLFPALLLVPVVLLRRWRTLGWAVASSAVLNLVGVRTFSLSLREALEGMSTAERT